MYWYIHEPGAYNAAVCVRVFSVSSNENHQNRLVYIYRKLAYIVNIGSSTGKPTISVMYIPKTRIYSQHRLINRRTIKIGWYIPGMPKTRIYSQHRLINRKTIKIASYIYIPKTRIYSQHRCINRKTIKVDWYTCIYAENAHSSQHQVMNKGKPSKSVGRYTPKTRTIVNTGS